MRRVIVVVFPVPAPARMATGPRTVIAALRWASLSPPTPRSGSTMPRRYQRRQTALHDRRATTRSADPDTLVVMIQTARATTIGELRASGYADRTVKQELRGNLLATLGRRESAFP